MPPEPAIKRTAAFIDGQSLFYAAKKPQVCRVREPFEEKMKRLTATLEERFTGGETLEEEIRKNLRGLGYTGLRSHEPAD